MPGIEDNYTILHDPTSPKQVEPYLFYRLIEESASRSAIHCYFRGLLLKCCGTLVTTIPGRKSNAAFSRKAVWLCKKFSHQCATTNSGRMTVSVSSGQSSCTVSI